MLFKDHYTGDYFFSSGIKTTIIYEDSQVHFDFPLHTITLQANTDSSSFELHQRVDEFGLMSKKDGGYDRLLAFSKGSGSRSGFIALLYHAEESTDKALTVSLENDYLRSKDYQQNLEITEIQAASIS